MKKTTYSSARIILALAMTLATLAAAAQKPWAFSLERYRDFDLEHTKMLSLTRPGIPTTAHIELTITNFRPGEVNSVMFTVDDNVLNEVHNFPVPIDSEGRVSADVPIDFEQHIMLNLPYLHLFVRPGDTLRITTEVSGYEPKSVRYEGSGESAAINAWRDTVCARFGVPENHYEIVEKAKKEGREGVMKQTREWFALLITMADTARAARLMADLPLSNFAKDLLFTNALTRMMTCIDEFGRFSGGHNDFDVDWKEFYAPLRPVAALLYDNPLILSVANAPSFINRSEYNAIFWQLQPIGLFGKKSQRLSEYLRKAQAQSLADYGIGSCFMADLANVRAMSLNTMSDVEKIIVNNPKSTERELFMAKRRIADCLVNIRNSQLVSLLLNRYGRMATTLGGAKETLGQNWTDEQRDLWKKLTEPYSGNLLYVDFWGMSCGPCRGGMISMRDKVEELAAEPIRFLYICNEKDSPRAEAEKWMTENNIKGEHIFVTHDEWNQLQQMFNFTGIPHAVLADKTGKVIQNDFQIYQHTAKQLREMITKF